MLEGVLSSLSYSVEKIDLRYPLNIENKSSFFVLPSLLQLVATWNRESKEGAFYCRLPLDDPSRVQSFVEEDHGFASIVMAWNRGIRDLEGNDLKSLIRPINKKYHEKMKALVNAKGNSLVACCFDHVPDGLLQYFYEGQNFIDHKEKLRFYFLEKGLDKVLTVHRKLRAAIDSMVPAILEIIFELLKNTHDWARTDQQNRRLRPNMRGVYLKFHRRRIDDLKADNGNHKGVSMYLDAPFKNVNEIGESYFLEISVFDSGPGFIARNKRNQADLSAKEQVAIVKRCLTKHYTSAKGIAQSQKGFGLDLVMQTLDNVGFMRIRTGEVNVYRNLVTDGYGSTQNGEPDVVLFDWNTNSDAEFSKVGPVSGSVVSIILPLQAFSK